MTRKGSTPRSQFRPRSKYGAVKTQVGNIVFASKKEAARYVELQLLERARKIHLLTVQPSFDLWTSAGKGYSQKPVGVYRADFSYCECGGGSGNCGWSRVTVEDVKGFKTPLYKWKKKHVEQQYGITIREI